MSHDADIANSFALRDLSEPQAAEPGRSGLLDQLLAGLFDGGAEPEDDFGEDAAELGADTATAGDAGLLADVLESAFAADSARVGETEVSNFNESGLTDSAEVSDYIESKIPPEHLEGLDSIKYVADQGAYEQGLQGMWQGDLATGRATIEIYPHDDKDGMYDTVAHEIGHDAEANLQRDDPGAVPAWNELHEQSATALEESGGADNQFVSPYATTSPEEDFAESYATFVNDPELLQATSPAKYEFMATHVFKQAV